MYMKNKRFTPTTTYIGNQKLKLVWGFTLVEIIVVIAIIATIAAIAIPSMLRSRMNANETIAITSCKTISSACQSYFSTKDTFPSSLADLAAPASTPPYIDDELASEEKAGYKFTYDPIDPVSFTLNADPRRPGRDGERYFYTDETGRITAKEGSRAGPGDPAV